MLHKILNKLIRSEFFDDENKEIYEYGLFIIINYSLLFLIAFILSKIFCLSYYLYYFTASILFVRSYTGGFHFKKYYHCLAFSIGELFVIAIILNNLILNNVLLLKSIALFSTLLVVFSPVDTANKKLSPQDSKKIKYKIIIILFGGMIISLVFYLFKIDKLLFSYFLALFHCLILLIFGIIDNKIRM